MMFGMIALAAMAQPVTVDAKLLAGLAPRTVVFTAHGKTQSCDGPLLADVAVRLGAPAGNDVRGDALRMVVMATARDGYRIAFTVGELDPLLGNRLAIVATVCDGKPLSAEDGPYRIVIADEKRGARSVRQLDMLMLLRVGDLP